LPRVGLGTVVEELLGVHLAKEHSAADWSTRPLPESWLVYAALDVELLVDLRDVMAQMLQAAGKAEIAAQEFEAVRLELPRVPRKEPWRRLSGIQTIRDPRQLAVARALWESRDELARESDIAAGRLVPDASLIAVAKAPPASMRELMGMKAFRGRASRTEIERWWRAVEAGLASEELPDPKPARETIPPPRSWRDRNPDAHHRFDAARAVLQAKAEDLELPTENLLKPGILRELAWQPPDDDSVEAMNEALAGLGARPWQVVATSQILTDAFVEAHQPDPETAPNE
jgi:ribonuclease D